MPTTITVTVKPNGGGDYTSIQAALTAQAAIRSNLVGTDEVLEIACYAGLDTTPVAVSGFTTDATHYIRIYCPAGEGHTGKYDTTKFRVQVSEARAFTIGSATTKHVRIEQMQAQVSASVSGNADCYFVSSAITAPSDIRRKNCIAKAVFTGTGAGGAFRSSSTAADDTTIVESYLNCVAIDFLNENVGTMFGWNSNAHSLSREYIYNCTAIRCNTGFRDRSNIRIKNCAAISCTNGFLPTSGPHAASTNNASTLNSDARGTNPKDKRAVLLVDPLNDDFRLHRSDSTTAGLKDQGVDLSADADFPFSDDISGTTRVAPWCIGASEADAAAVQAVRWVHVGGVTATTAKVLAHLEQADATVHLRYGTDPTLATFATATAASGANNNALFALTGLTPNTVYYYVVEIGGTVYTDRAGRFKSFPVGGTFSFVASGDIDTGIGAPVYGVMDALDPLLLLLIGDQHYEDIASNDITLFRKAYDTIHHNLQPFAFYQHRAVAYVWDDHDFGGPSSDSTATAKPAAQDAYRENVAHHTLPAGDPGQFPIYHSFVIGRCRFVVSDLRSARTPNGAADDANKTMMGATQKQWFKDQLVAARQANQIVFWICEVPWITSAIDPADSWQGFKTERKELCDFMQANEITNLIRLSADAHMIALDDGGNDLFTSDGKGNKHVTFQVAPLRQNNASVGGPYSHGIFANNNNQFGLITVIDPGGSSITVRFSGRTMDTELVTYEKTYIVVPSERSELVTGLLTRALPFDGWVRGLVQEAGVGTLPIGTTEDGTNFVPLPAGRLETRGGSRVLLTLNDDGGVPAELTHVLGLFPKALSGAVAIGWADATDKHYAYALTSDIAFAGASEAASRTAFPSTWTRNAPGRPVAARLFERLYVCDAQPLYANRNTLVVIDAVVPPGITEPTFEFVPGGAAAAALRPYCLEEYNNVLFIAGYGDEETGMGDAPETVRHSFLGRVPSAANGFDPQAFNVIGAEGERVTAMKKGRGLLLLAKANELYRLSGFGRAYPGWQYQVEPIFNTDGFGVANPLGLEHAESWWYGIGRQGPFRTDGFTVQSLVGPRQRVWRGMSQLEFGWVRYHPDRRLVLFGLHPAESPGAKPTYPYILWAWDVDRSVWTLDHAYLRSDAGADYLDIATIATVASETVKGPTSPPGALVNSLITTSGWRAGWTNGDTSTGNEIEYWEKKTVSGTWELKGVIAVTGASNFFDVAARLNHTEYWWKVRARKNGLFSAYSAEIRVRTLISQPTISFVECLGGGQLHVRVTQNATGTSCRVETSPFQQAAWTTVVTFSGTSQEVFVNASNPIDIRARSSDAAWSPPDSVFDQIGGLDC